MAFYSFGKKHIEAFLEEYLNILGLESILFVLQKPVWVKGKQDAMDFWGARGVVREFLKDLWSASLAPIPYEETVREDFRRNHKQDRHKTAAESNAPERWASAPPDGRKLNVAE